MSYGSTTQTIWQPTQDSIFGYTYNGVPNPLVPDRHPYPTRFHGPIYTVPGVADLPYMARPYLNQPMPTGGAGLGATITEPVTGASAIDGALGASMGYAFAPSKDARLGWAVMGGAAGMLFGGLGLVGIFGLGVYHVAGTRRTT